MEKTLFKNIKDYLIENIGKANERIRIAVAWFTNDDLFQAVLKALDKNIQVELILIDDCINRHEFGLDFGAFIVKGGHLFFSTGLKNMHNKFCMIDNSIVITGSYNWTYYAENKNWENILTTDEESVINEYCKEFDSIKSQLVETKEYHHYKLNEVDPAILLNEYDYIYEDLHYKEESLGKGLSNYLLDLKESIVIERKNSVEAPKSNTTIVSKIITHQSLGIRCKINGKDNCTFILIPKGTEIPCENKREFYTTVDNQTSLPCETLIGESLDANQNRSIGKIVLNDIPPLPQGQGKMEVHFVISSDKTLHVRATNLHTRTFVEANYYLSNTI